MLPKAPALPALPARQLALAITEAILVFLAYSVVWGICVGLSSALDRELGETYGLCLGGLIAAGGTAGYYLLRLHQLRLHGPWDCIHLHQYPDGDADAVASTLRLPSDSLADSPYAPPPLGTQPSSATGSRTALLKLILIGLLACLLIQYGHDLILRALDCQEEAQNITNSLGPLMKEGIFAKLCALAMLAIAAPLAEEIIFRGFLQSALSRRLAPFAAIAVSSIIFGAIHFDLQQTPALIALGLVFGTLRARSGSILPGLVCHSINNAIAGYFILFAASP